MPAVSKAQYELMRKICHGELPDGHRGISKDVACKYVRETKEEDIKNLVERIRPKEE